MQKAQAERAEKSVGNSTSRWTPWKTQEVRTLMRDSQVKEGPMDPVRRSFLPTFQGAPQTGTKMEPGLSEEQRKNCRRMK